MFSYFCAFRAFLRFLLLLVAINVHSNKEHHLKTCMLRWTKSAT